MPVIFLMVVGLIGTLVGYHLTWYFYIIPIALILISWEGTKGGLESVVPVLIVYASSLLIIGMGIGDMARYGDLSFLEIFVDKG